MAIGNQERIYATSGHAVKFRGLLTLDWGPDFILIVAGMSHGLQIGEVAKRTRLTIDTIRFYEKRGLFKVPARSEGGFRLFSSDTVDQLTFIRKAKELGFSLDEIRELLVVRHGDVRACSHVRDLLKQKLASVRSKIEELKAMEDTLKRGLSKCNRELREAGTRHEECCPVLREIGRRNEKGSNHED